jgi:hypothetical protein
MWPQQVCLEQGLDPSRSQFHATYVQLLRERHVSIPSTSSTNYKVLTDVTKAALSHMHVSIPYVHGEQNKINCKTSRMPITLVGTQTYAVFVRVRQLLATCKFVRVLRIHELGRKEPPWKYLRILKWIFNRLGRRNYGYGHFCIRWRTFGFQSNLMTNCICAIIENSKVIQYVLIPFPSMSKLRLGSRLLVAKRRSERVKWNR